MLKAETVGLKAKVNVNTKAIITITAVIVKQAALAALDIGNTQTNKQKQK